MVDFPAEKPAAMTQDESALSDPNLGSIHPRVDSIPIRNVAVS